jgi:hypothetical protein
MKKIYLLILVILFSSFYFCENDNSINGSKIPKGAYAYTGFDSTGVKIVRGWIKIVFDDSIHISGEWELDKIGDPQNIGPQVGSGILLGSYDKRKIVIELNPDYVDNNVSLIGEWDENKIEGEWMYGSLHGIVNHGTFKAEKR